MFDLESVCVKKAFYALQGAGLLRTALVRMDKHRMNLTQTLLDEMEKNTMYVS